MDTLSNRPLADDLGYTQGNKFAGLFIHIPWQKFLVAECPNDQLIAAVNVYNGWGLMPLSVTSPQGLGRSKYPHHRDL